MAGRWRQKLQARDAVHGPVDESFATYSAHTSDGQVYNRVSDHSTHWFALQ